MKEVSAYIPCFNNEDSIGDAIQSVLDQTCPIQRVLVLDDGSTDGSIEAAKSKGVEVVGFGENRGRGFIRAQATERLESPFSVCCDATNVLDPKFVENALPLFDDPNVAGAYGNLSQRAAIGLGDRWRDRHLFKPTRSTVLTQSTHLSTWGVMMRRSAVLEVGNFDSRCRHTEDIELGVRLLAAGRTIYAAPDCRVYSNVSNTAMKALERYWRWNVGSDERYTFKDYFKRTWYSLRVLAARDLAERDVPAAGLSLLTAQYGLYKALRGKQNRR